MDTAESAPRACRRLDQPGIEAAAATHAVRRRTNADAFLIDEAAGFYAVADGMGDSPRSGLVARMALEAVREIFLAPWVLLPPGERSAGEAIERMLLGLVQAHGRLYAPGRQREERIGTTFAGVVVCGDALCFGSVGDSRAYLLRRRQGTLVQVKEDDTVCGEAVLRGVSPEEAAMLPRAGVLTRLLGATSGAPVVPVLRRWEPGDAVLLCTDGVSDCVEVGALARLLLEEEGADDAAHRIIGRAIDAGGSDNATALVVRRAS